MIKTNKDKIIKLSVQGEVSAPIASAVGKVSSDGTVFNLPGTGGITYNLKIGDMPVVLIVTMLNQVYL